MAGTRKRGGGGLSLPYTTREARWVNRDRQMAIRVEVDVTGRDSDLTNRLIKL